MRNESSPFCRTEWFHVHVNIAFLHLSVWLIAKLLVKVVGSYKVDQDSIPGSSQLRQKSGIEQEIANF